MSPNPARHGLQLRLHHLEPRSQANGPGLRAVVWLQGCTLDCPGCFNPDTHPSRGGTLWQTHALTDWLLAIPDIEGLTLSGGEPLQQIGGVTQLLQEVRQRSGLSTIVFTGYERSEVDALAQSRILLEHIDVLITGRYQAGRRLAHTLLGSDNQEMHFLSSRYCVTDFATIPEAEIILTPEGDVLLTGINPPTF